jgi:hypothetical protein
MASRSPFTSCDDESRLDVDSRLTDRTNWGVTMLLKKVSEGASVAAAAAPVTESALLRMSQRALDDLFRSSRSGPVPDGDMRGTLVAFPGTPLAKPLAVLAYLFAWQGKVVDNQRGTLVNKITPFRLRTVKALVRVDDSWVDNAPCVLIDYSRTSLLARAVRDEIRLVGPQLYLGVVWLRRRRVGWFTLRQPARTGRRR